ncbi:alpha-L-fucosidase [Salinibacterium sp.]|uniref:alpha-L-fucosidase n=1 Tax=Salinibacterium sp. TaxID=1915057 RepID=UPI00286BA667|nr:alpha-L-fucosidase [Salinibacterium sp.]
MKVSSHVRRRSRGLMLLTATATMVGLLVTGAPAATAADSLAQQWVTNNPFGMFLHYGPGTYTGQQWSNPQTGTTDFNPTQTVNTDQWAAAMKSAGMTFGVLTAKHHDGFALWPTAFSNYDIAASPYQNGNGDIVRDYTNSMRAAGLKVGIYFSIWDQHNLETTALVKNQLSDLLQNYGTIDSLWFDGWGCQTGCANIDYAEVRAYIRSLSPTTVVANNVHGNNSDSDLNVYEVPIDGLPPQDSSVKDTSDTLDTKSSWFAAPETGEPKAAQAVVDTIKTVNARNSLYLLNVGPGKDGTISAPYASRLAEIGSLLDQPNLALGATATQSSTEYGGAAGRATDGNTDGNFAANSVSHTGNSQYSWWDANLGAAAKVSSVEVYNRDSYGSRLSDYWVMVSDRPFTPGLSPAAQAAQSWVSSSHQTTQAGSPTKIAIPGGKIGQYVRVQLAGTGYLALTEVKVLGTKNLISGSVATQSSTEFGGAASRANDGNTNGNFSSNSVSHTGSGQYSWWDANLGAAAKVSSVQVFNRNDSYAERLTDYWVMVADRPFTAGLSPTAQAAQSWVWSSRQTTKAGSPSTVTIPGGKVGQYVRVQLAGTGYLALTEVKALG